jgi:tripartite-type tricarboxylate transporter receptor subunit TctC
MLKNPHPSELYSAQWNQENDDDPTTLETRLTKPIRALRVHIAFLLASLAVPGSMAQAQGVSQKPVTIIVQSAGGSVNDSIARVVADEMARTLGRPFLVDNKPGAGGIVALQALLRAPADGDTLMVSTQPQLFSEAMKASLPYKSIADFTAVAALASVGGVLAVSTTVDGSDVKSFVAALKAKPAHYKFGTVGVGTTSHLYSELFLKEANATAVHVPYKSSPNMIVDLVSGQLDWAMIPLGLALPFAREGKLKLLGVTRLQRMPETPEVPSIAEQGLPGFDAVGGYYLIAAKGVPPRVVETLNKAAIAAVASDAFKQRMRVLGGALTASPASPARVAAEMLTEETRWNGLAKDAKIVFE